MDLPKVGDKVKWIGGPTFPGGMPVDPEWLEPNRIGVVECMDERYVDVRMKPSGMGQSWSGPIDVFSARWEIVTPAATYDPVQSLVLQGYDGSNE